MIDMFLTWPTEVHGIKQPAGAIVSVDPHTAGRLLQRSRARLVDAADLVVILRHTERAKASPAGAGPFLTRGR